MHIIHKDKNLKFLEKDRSFERLCIRKHSRAYSKVKISRQREEKRVDRIGGH